MSPALLRVSYLETRTDFFEGRYATCLGSSLLEREHCFRPQIRRVTKAYAGPL